MHSALFRQLFLQALDREILQVRTAVTIQRNLQIRDFQACCAVARDMDDAYSQFLDQLRPVAWQMGVVLDDCRLSPVIPQCLLP